jgi:hypothetical protein
MGETSLVKHQQDKFVINPAGQADQCLGAEQSVSGPATAVKFANCDGSQSQLWARIHIGALLQWQNVELKSCLQGMSLCP